MNPATDFQSGDDRRHTDPPNLWLAVLAGSLAVHLLLLLSGRLFLFRATSQKLARAAAPIELIDISPKSSNKVARSAVSKVSTPSTNSQRAVSSNATSQSAAPTQPAIVQQPIPRPNSQPAIIQQPIPRPTPQIKPSIKPTPSSSYPSGTSAATPTPLPLPSVRVFPTVPETIPSAPPTFPNSESTGTESGDRPTFPDATASSPGSADPDNTPSAVPDSSADSSGKEPSAPEPIGSDQTLSSELSVESNIGSLEKIESPTRESGANANAQTDAKSATLQGRSTQLLSIQFPPTLKLAPNQVINLTVLVVLDNTSGKVVSSEVLPESRAFQEFFGLNQDDLNSTVKRIFENLTFNVKVELENLPRKTEAPSQSPWKVPVQIRVIK